MCIRDSWYIVETDDVHLPQHSDEEAATQAAWKGFYDVMTISARYHPELRRQFIPKRLWRNIVELHDEAAAGSAKRDVYKRQAENPFEARLARG